MAFVDWDEKYSVGIKDIDTQHKRLFDLINEFYEAVKDGKIAAGTAKVIDGLLSYTVFHFGFEERLMERYSYAGLAGQKVSHKIFTDKIAEYQARFASGKLLMTIEVTNYLKTWLTEHIMKSDMQYAPVLGAVGVR
jgi:hemerythrin